MPNQPESLYDLAASIARDFVDRVRRTEAAREPFASLLEDAGVMPSGSSNAIMEERSELIDAAFEGFATHLLATGHLAAALVESVRAAEDRVIARISAGRRKKRGRAR